MHTTWLLKNNNNCKSFFSKEWSRNLWMIGHSSIKISMISLWTTLDVPKTGWHLLAKSIKRLESWEKTLRRLTAESWNKSRNSRLFSDNIKMRSRPKRFAGKVRIPRLKKELQGKIGSKPSERGSSRRTFFSIRSQSTTSEMPNR